MVQQNIATIYQEKYLTDITANNNIANVPRYFKPLSLTSSTHHHHHLLFSAKMYKTKKNICYKTNPLNWDKPSPRIPTPTRNAPRTSKNGLDRMNVPHRFHDEEHANLLNSMWLTAITFLCVGYGDIVPNTYCGRGITLTCGMVVSTIQTPHHSLPHHY